MYVSIYLSSYLSAHFAVCGARLKIFFVGKFGSIGRRSLRYIGSLVPDGPASCNAD